MVLRRAADRFVTRTPGVQTRHCFSFGSHYDPAHVGHGPLVVHDEHLLAPGAGFAPHPHRDVEVVSWVLEGELVHEDALGTTVVPAGGLQRTTAGSGVVHAERAGSAGARFVQLWLRAWTPDLQPAYEPVAAPAGTGLLPAVVATGVDAAVHVGRLAEGQSAALPAAVYVHVFVAAGRVELAGEELLPGDSARLTRAAPCALRAGGRADVLVVTCGQE